MPFLKEIRKDLGLTQAEAGELTGITQAGYSKQELETGPSADTIAVLTAAGASVEFIIRGTGPFWAQGYTRPRVIRTGKRVTLEPVRVEESPQPQALIETDGEAYLAAEQAIDSIAPELKRVPAERADLIAFAADHYAYLRHKGRTQAFEARVRRILEVGRTLSRKPK